VVKRTAKRLQEGKAVTGWPALAKLLGEGGGEKVGRIKHALGLVVTLAELAAHKQLPTAFLESLGLGDRPEGGVVIRYTDEGGGLLAEKVRLGLSAATSLWPKGGRLFAYGLDRLGEAARLGYLPLVEGESDCWTLWHHGQPALGIPGADAVSLTLEAAHLRDVRRVYVVEEADAKGPVFVANVRRQLGLLGWPGELLVVRCFGAKDVSDLHCQDPGQFAARWAAALEKAERVEVTAGPAGVGGPSPPAEPPWPAPLAEEAFYGLAGDIVRVLEPASEADPAALLSQVLLGFGNLIGRTAHAVVEADTHFGNEFLILVGKSSKARKGTSAGRIHRLFREAEEEWARERVQTGLSSGEGLIWSVRDPIMKRERVKEKGQPVRYEEVEADPGVADKRLLVYEPEFANVLKQTERQGNTLSAVLRQAWESGDLRSMTKNSPARATGAHVSLVGHITREELRRYLSTTEMANGFANRFLWTCVKRSKLLPRGGRVDEAALADVRSRLAAAIGAARGLGQVTFDEEACRVWDEVYGPLSEGQPGLSGALLGRAEAHALRLSLLYAALDGSPQIQPCHLLAALAVWDYCEASVRHLFGDALGDPVADELLRLLRAAPGGMTRGQMCDHFGRNQSSDRIGKALALLAEHGLARFERQETGGRPREVWFAVGR
jgi:hypothetical protein